MTTILLGPQRFTVTLGAAVRSLGLDGPIAMITSGWEEREDDVDELNGHLEGRGRNLRLHHRMLDVFETDAALAAAARGLRDAQDELRAFYGIRLQSAVDAVHAVARRTSLRAIGPVAERSAIEAVRDVDRWYAAQLAELYRLAMESTPPERSAPVGWHRGEVRAMIDDCAAVVITGGNVRTVVRTLKLFDVTVPADKPVVAWSAGAMALTEQVVLFHDYTAQGISAAEVHDVGMGRLPGVIALPHAKRRLRLHDHQRMAVLAKRFADAELVLLDDGAIVRFGDDSVGLPPGARRLGQDGRVSVVAAA